MRCSREESNASSPGIVPPHNVGLPGPDQAEPILHGVAQKTVERIRLPEASELNPYMYLVHIFSKMPGLDFKSDPSLLEDFMPWSQKLPDYCRNTKH